MCVVGLLYHYELYLVEVKIINKFLDLQKYEYIVSIMKAKVGCIHTSRKIARYNHPLQLGQCNSLQENARKC